MRREGWIRDALAGLSGPLPTIWSALRGWSKAERRSVLQAYGTAILCFALVAQFAAGILTAEFWKLVLIALPGTILRPVQLQGGAR